MSVPAGRENNRDSVSSGERKRMRLNHAHVIPGRGCVCGVVGAFLSGLPAGRGVRKCCVSRTALERATVDGDSPVGESLVPVVGVPE